MQHMALEKLQMTCTGRTYDVFSVSLNVVRSKHAPQDVWTVSDFWLSWSPHEAPERTVHHVHACT
jgi:hypothetical protein